MRREDAWKTVYRVLTQVGPARILLAAMAFSLVFNMWAGSGNTFSGDELAWLIQSPGLTLEELFHPHVGHLVATSKALYWVVLETVGPEYWVFRLLAALCVIGVAGALFALARKALGEWMALGIALVILFFGGDPLHTLAGNGFTILFSILCGLVALLLMDREGAAAKVLACLLLCLGVLTYSMALPFLVGVAALLVLKKDLKNLWVPAVPFLLYLGWWVWSQDLPTTSQDSLALDRLALVPSWGFQTTSAMLGDLSGLQFSFGGGSYAGADAGPVLTLLLIFTIGLALSRREQSRDFWMAGLMLLVLWTLAVIVPAEERLPESTRYMYPVAIITMLVWIYAWRRLPRARATQIAVGLAVAVSCLGGLNAIRTAGHDFRDRYAFNVLSGLAGIEAAGSIDPNVIGDQVADREEQPDLNLPFRAVDDLGKPSVKLYMEAVTAYGALGFSEQQLAEKGPVAQQLADQALVRTLGIPFAVPAGPTVGACIPVMAGIGGQVDIRLPRGRFRISNPTGETAQLFIGKFSPTGAYVGEIPAGQGVEIEPAPQFAGRGLRLRSPVALLRACRPTPA